MNNDFFNTHKFHSGTWQRPLFAGMLAGAGLLGLAGPAKAQDTVDLDNGLELYWTFDEGQGDMAGDLTNQSRFGTLFDDPLFADKTIFWTEGRFGGAVDFDLTYFLAANGFYGIGGTEPRTISIWINTSWPSNNQGVLVGFGPNATSQRWHFKIHSANEEGLAPIRTENQGGNNFGAIPVNDGEWHNVICVFPEGGTTIGDVNHYIDGVFDEAKNGGVGNPVDTVIDPALGAPPFTVGGSQFGTGFRYTQSLIDEVRIYNRALNDAEIQALANGEGVQSGAPPSIGFPDGLKNNPFVSVSEAVSISVTGIGDATLDAGDISVTINGEPAGDAAVIDGSGSSFAVDLSSLEENQNYNVAVTATDSDGRTVTREITFSTYTLNNFIIEAEDYNFGGGQFYDNAVLCNTLGSEDGCYFDKMSVEGVDAFDTNGAGDNSASLDIYRYSPGSPDREENFDTNISGDLIRDSYFDAGLSEYDVDLMAAGDWANYTRTFEADSAFKILLRASTGAAQQFRLDRVVGAADTADQVVEPLGFFNLSGGSGYRFINLTDATGETELTISFSGEETLRLTSVDGNNNASLNYLMFVPSTVTTILPTVAITSPSNGERVSETEELVVEVDAADEDGTVVKVEIFYVRGEVRESAGVLEEPPFNFSLPAPGAGSYTLVAEATDNAGLVSLSETVSIVADSTAATLNVVRGAPTLDAIELIFDEPIDPEGASDTSLYSIDPSISISEVIVDRRRVTLLTGNQTEGTTYTVTATNIPDFNGFILESASSSFEAASSNLSYGLDGYWPFDEGAGNVAFDVSGSGHNAGIYDVPQYVDASIIHTEGRFGGAINFDGTYFLGVPSYYGIGGANPRTISLWINTDIATISGSNTIIGWGSGANTARYHFKLEGSNGVTLRTENAGGNNFGSVPVNTGEWTHIAAVFTGDDEAVGAVDHFINAILDEAKNGGIGNPVNTNITPGVAAPVTLGGAPLGLGGSLRPVPALLDDVRIYNRALSLEELEALAAGEGVIQGPVVDTNRPTLAIAIGEAGAAVLTWEGNAVLQSAEEITGPWTDVADAVSPYSSPIEGTVFFRLITGQ